MDLLLNRVALKENYTIGHLYVNGEYFCDTLEDTVRDFNKDGDLNEPGEEKVYGKTAIPYGTYRVIIDYSPHFKRNMPHVLNVKGFEGIRIHAGNDEFDTLGCILVGENKVVGKVLNSKAVFSKLFDLMETANVINLVIE